MFRVLPLAALSLLAVPAFAAEPAPVASLVARVDIPYQQFTLANGLKVLIHTDRKAPVVAVSIWYHIGSKDEPPGKTGFAHLYEHLMFNGSENSPSDFFEPLQQMGATDYNGTTWFDRTNYFETVPTGALERTLFLESDRMGHLLGGLDQTKLDNQRAVVQNEKREDDNQPFGLVDYLVQATLFPPGHPYHHETIGSMGDLNAASLETVKNWFRANYGPDNAVLVLAGDVDAATAKPLVEKWFGAIPRGPAVSHPAAPVPTLPAPITKVIKDQVPFTRIMRTWAVEGVNGADTTALEVAASVLGGLSSSRLDNALLRGDKTAVHVEASVQAFEAIGVLTVSADVKPGQDANAVARRVDAVIADFLKSGPTADEVRRVATRSIAGTIGGYESVGGFGGKAVALAEGQVYSNDPAHYRRELDELAAMTPTRVTAAARKWMGRPAFNLTIEPGPRDTSPEMAAITGDVTPATGRGPSFYRKPGKPAPAPLMAAPDRKNPPQVGQLAALDFPKIERATLSNGIPVIFARRAAVPAVRVAVSFDAGFAADPKDALGTQSLMMALLDEGTMTRSSVQIAETQERLGATISTGSSLDRSTAGLFALTPNLGASVELLADIVRNPKFDPSEVERLRGQQLALIGSQLSDPSGVAKYLLPGLIYGRDHPYGVPSTGTGESAAVARVTRDQIADFHRTWFRPDTAQIFVVGDTSLAAIVPLLEANFGNWPSDRRARPAKTLAAAIPPAQGRVVLVDRPGAVQSVIYGGEVLGMTGRDDLVPLKEANEVLGGAFLARLNTDLRETKGWSYGVQSGVQNYEGRTPFLVQAPVQTDRTGESYAALIADINAYLGPQGTTQAERDRTINGSIRELPGQFETSDAVLSALQRIVWLGRPDDFYPKLPARYRAMTPATMDAAARAAIDPARMSWVVVGDVAKVKPQFDKLGIATETMAAPAAK